MGSGASTPTSASGAISVNAVSTAQKPNQKPTSHTNQGSSRQLTHGPMGGANKS